MPQRAINAYFSHSYRSTDRAVNEYFVDLMYESGFTLTVDPKSTSLSPTHLEMTMRDSDCFVGVVTRRDDQPRYRCSPFAVYEYELALRAPRKPRILFVERGVSEQPFLAGDLEHVFSRSDLSRFEPPVDDLTRIAAAARASGAVSNRPRGRVGLVLPESGYAGATRQAIIDLLRDIGYRPVDLKLGEFPSVVEAAQLDAVDFVLVDVAAPDVPAWVVPYITWRFIPSIKLIQHEPGAQPPPALPAIVRSAALEAGSAANRHAIWWSDRHELISELALQINQLDRPRRQFADADEGKAYFRSLGRANGPVFISNAWDDNPLAERITAELVAYNIDYFHYQYHNTIPVSTTWRHRLLGKVDESRIFVPLLSRSYQGSEWCQKEFVRAEELRRIGRLTMIPYFLDRLTGVDSQVQGVSLMHLSTEERVARIIADLQASLEAEGKLRHRPTAVIGSEQRPVRADIAVIAVTEEMYRAVESRLDGAEPVTGTAQHPNRSSWVTGTVNSPRKGRYRVVLARPETPDEDAGRAIRRTVDAFEPDSVVLLGTAQAVGRRSAEGDVLVTTQIYGFEHRQGRLAPRPGWNFPADPAVSASARTVSMAPLADVAARHGVTTNPRVLVGPVACGRSGAEPHDDVLQQIDEVWPDVVAADETMINVVELLEELREHGRITQFSALWSVCEDDKPVNAAYSADVGTVVLTRLVADVWPRPPAGDEPEENLYELGSGPA
ncbi:TIR domain-containing protein [Paractinoplanes maris]|uniref:TIR domain-containing protein n=1 Tax=Paractinoplanes maris TaxID=1734446 RepID=UPI0020215F02|nr:TIR domain-containing protein [Actinoplanes maris]